MKFGNQNAAKECAHNKNNEVNAVLVATPP